VRSSHSGDSRKLDFHLTAFSEVRQKKVSKTRVTAACAALASEPSKRVASGTVEWERAGLSSTLGP
jgi:hypothetical protein